MASSIAFASWDAAAQPQAELTCFNELYAGHMCCDESYGPGGLPFCWSAGYTFDTCCGQLPAPKCSPQLCAEVWDYIQGSYGRTFRDLWRSEAFYEVKRVYGDSPNCTLAYVASRVLAFTKLGWAEQWDILADPEAVAASRNFQVPVIFEALHLLTTQLPLWLALNSPPWSSFIFGRLHGHSKKLAYWLFSDGLPVLRGKTPASDVLDTEPHNEAFKEALKYGLNRGLPLAGEAEAYLELQRSRSEALPLFGKISALLALARAALSERGVPWGQRLARARDAVEDVEAMLRESVHANGFGDLLLTQWPVLRLLAQLAAPALLRKVLPERKRQPSRTLVFACSGAVQEEVAAKYHWELRGFDAADPDACSLAYQRALRSEELHSFDWVLLISPFSYGLSSEQARALRDALALAPMNGPDVLGLPTVDGQGVWQWPARRLRRRAMSLLYEPYPTGYPAASGLCAIAGTTSGTRALRRMAKSWLLQLVGRPAGEPVSAANFIVELDLITQSGSSVRGAGDNGFAYTCLFQPLAEESYLEHAILDAEFAARHRLQEAHFTSTNYVLRCDLLDAEGPERLAAELPIQMSHCATSDLSSLLSTLVNDLAAGGVRRAGPAEARHSVWVELDCLASTLSGAGSRDPCTSSPSAVARFRLHQRALADDADAGGLPTLAPSRRTARTTAWQPLALCHHLEQLHAGIGSCQAMSQDHVLVCGPRASGCVELMLQRSGATNATSHVSVPLWGSRVWAPFSGSLRDGASISRSSGTGSSSSSGQSETQRLPHKQFIASELQVLAIYCGTRPLDLPTSRLGWRVRTLPVDARRCRLQALRVLKEEAWDTWVLWLSPFSWRWTETQSRAVERVLAEHGAAEAEGRWPVIGFPAVDSSWNWRWTAARIRHRYWKLQYIQDQYQDLIGMTTGIGNATGSAFQCKLGDSTSGTRLYAAGMLTALLDASPAVNETANLLVGLDLTALRLGVMPVLTCAFGALELRSVESEGVVFEEDFLEKATLPAGFAAAYQVEVAEFTPGNAFEQCAAAGDAMLGWGLAHANSDQRLASPLCYRRHIERQFCDVVAWWRGLVPDGSTFASVKQGTLLTAMIRGGDVAMMPWDNDLEMGLYSTGQNPVLAWCAEHTSWTSRVQCLQERLSVALGLPVNVDTDLVSRWLHGLHGKLEKLRIMVDNTLDVLLEGNVPLMPVTVRMFGQAEVRVSWPLWDYLFFEVFRGSWEKKVGTSGTVERAAHAESCASQHSACIPGCTRAFDGATCVLEFPDFFAHTRDQYGRLFPPELL